MCLGVLLLAITVAVVLFWLDRKEKAYLWLGLACGGVALDTVVTLLGNYTSLLPSPVFFLLSDAILKPLMIALWIIFWAYWFRMGRMERMHKMVWGFALVLALTMAMMRAPLLWPPHPGPRRVISRAALRFSQTVARRIVALGGVGRHAQGSHRRMARDARRRADNRLPLSAGIARPACAR